MKTQVNSFKSWTQVNSFKSSSFPEIISPKLFGNSWGNSYFQFLVIISFYVSTTLKLRLQQESEWVSITLKDETKILHRKVTLSPMILKKFALLSFAFNLRGQDVTDFSFISLTQKFVLSL